MKRTTRCVMVLFLLSSFNVLSHSQETIQTDLLAPKEESSGTQDKATLLSVKDVSDAVQSSPPATPTISSGPSTQPSPASSKELEFFPAFMSSISMIVVSELGDKTFFIAAIMAMRHSRLIIYSGAMSALGAMTILSALLGNIVTKFIQRIYTYYLSSILFACFGIKMLRDGYLMSPDEGTEEYEEAEHEVEKAEVTDDLELGGGGGGSNSSIGNSQTQRSQSILKQRSTLTKFTSILRRYVSPIFIQAFIMTFLAEWGDRSQITTIVLAASENLFGVIVGGTIGHGLCTGLAVLGGRFVAQRISPKTVTLVGGIVFICFAFSAFFIRPDK